MSQLNLQKKPELQYNQEVDLIGEIKNLGKAIKGFFRLNPAPLSTPTTVASNTTTHAHIEKTVVKYKCTEFDDLLYSDRLLILPFESEIVRLRDLICYRSYACSAEEFYDNVLNVLPDSIIESMTTHMNEYLTDRQRWFNDGDSYEEILKKFMGFAADKNNNFWLAFSVGNLYGDKIFNIVIELVNKFTDKSYKSINMNIIPIKPILLAFLWSCLLMELTYKYTNSCDDFEKKRIAKIGLSLVIALCAGFTGYAHSGGYTGLPSVTSWIRTYYNALRWAEDEYPYYYSYIPALLKFGDCSDFNNFLESMQITAGKGLNMIYTFRIGDSLLENLSSATLVSDDVVKRTIKSIWPLPMTYESQKVYRLYTEDKIYNL